MTLRLVLVSLVAAMGFTIPGTPVIENWVASTQDWMNARYADWDTRNFASTEKVIVRNRMLESLVSRQPLPLSETVITSEVLSRSSKKPRSLVEDSQTRCSRPVKLVPKCSASEVLEIGEKPLTDIAFRLNPRNSGGRAGSLEGPPAPSPSRVKFDAFSTLGQAARPLTASLDTWRAFIARSLSSFHLTVASHPRTEPNSRVNTPATELAAEPKSKTQELGIKVGEAGVPRCHASASESFGAMEQSESLYFAADMPQVSEILVVTLLASKPCTPALASATAVCSIAAPASTVVDDVDEEMTGCLHSFDDGFGHPVGKPAVERQTTGLAPGTQKVARKPEEVAGIDQKRAIKPHFEPLEVGEYQPTIIAFDLNRRIDGSKNTSGPAEATIAPIPTALTVRTVLPVPTAKSERSPMRPAPDLSRAVKLTREAVYAWVNVLAGPAIVTVAQPSSNRIQ